MIVPCKVVGIKQNRSSKFLNYAWGFHGLLVTHQAPTVGVIVFRLKALNAVGTECYH